MTRTTITWLDIFMVIATVSATAAYYMFGIDTVQLPLGGITISLVQHGKFIVLAYVVLEILSGALGEGGNEVMYWLSYTVSLIAAFVFSIIAGYVYLGIQQNYDMVLHLLAVPYAQALLIGLVVFSWFSALVLQAHKHTTAWEHITAARAIAPAAPVPPTIPAPVAPPVPGSAASVVIVLLLLMLIGAVALMTLGGGRLTYRAAADTIVEPTTGTVTDKSTSCFRSTNMGKDSHGVLITPIEPVDC